MPTHDDTASTAATESGARAGRALRLLFLLPLASLVIVEVYVARFDGWGAWAAAPLLLLPLLVSVPIVLWGLVRIASRRRTGASYIATLGWTIIAGLPILWLGVRRFF